MEDQCNFFPCAKFACVRGQLLYVTGTLLLLPSFFIALKSKVTTAAGVTEEEEGEVLYSGRPSHSNIFSPVVERCESIRKFQIIFASSTSVHCRRRAKKPLRWGGRLDFV